MEFLWSLDLGAWSFTDFPLSAGRMFATLTCNNAIYGTHVHNPRRRWQSIWSRDGGTISRVGTGRPCRGADAGLAERYARVVRRLRVGVAQGGAAKAYDWKRLRRERVINDAVGGVPIVLALGPDTVSYFAFQRPDAATRFALRGDSLVSAQTAYALNGKGPAGTLPPINASQEFWHSWRTFQPATARY